MFDILIGIAIYLGVAFILRVASVGEGEMNYQDLLMIALWPIWIAVILLMAVFAILDGAGRNIARLINKCGGKL